MKLARKIGNPLSLKLNVNSPCVLVPAPFVFFYGKNKADDPYNKSNHSFIFVYLLYHHKSITFFNFNSMYGLLICFYENVVSFDRIKPSLLTDGVC